MMSEMIFFGWGSCLFIRDGGVLFGFVAWFRASCSILRRVMYVCMCICMFSVGLFTYVCVLYVLYIMFHTVMLFTYECVLYTMLCTASVFAYVCALSICVTGWPS